MSGPRDDGVLYVYGADQAAGGRLTKNCRELDWQYVSPSGSATALGREAVCGVLELEPHTINRPELTAAIEAC